MIGLGRRMQKKGLFRKGLTVPTDFLTWFIISLVVLVLSFLGYLMFNDSLGGASNFIVNKFRFGW